MSYTLIDVEDTQVTANANEDQSDKDNNAINNENMTRDDDGDIQMEDQNVETCKFLTSLLSTAATITIYLPILDFFTDNYDDDPITPDDIVEDDTSSGEGVNLNIPYKTSGEFIDGDDPVCVYDNCSIYQNMNKFELYSIHLADLVAEYAVPRECHRQLVPTVNKYYN